MLDTDAVPWGTRKCCTKDMRKAVQMIALMHMIFFGPLLFAMIYVHNNKHDTLFFGDKISGPLPYELELLMLSSFVVLGVRLILCLVLFVAENIRSIPLLRLWMALHLLLSLAECGLVTALSTVIFEVDPDIEPFVGTLVGGFILLGLETYALHVVLCMHTGLMKERVLRTQVARMQRHISSAQPPISLSPAVPRGFSRMQPWSGASTPGVNDTK